MLNNELLKNLTIWMGAIYHLLEREFDVVGVVSGDKNASPIICCRWTTKELTK